MVFGAAGFAYFSGRASSEEALAILARKLAADNDTCAVSVATLKGGAIEQIKSVSVCSAVVDSNAIFQAASLSKPVVAFLALKMSVRGGLALDEPVSRILPDGYPHRQNIFSLKATPIIDQVSVDVLRRITPRQLLMHTAGFRNWSPSGPLALEFAPGSRWQYSGEGYVLLQKVMETATGRSLQQLAERDVFEPLGLASTAFKTTDAIKPHLVPGSPRQLRFPYEIAASSLYTTAGDYARFVAGLLNNHAMLEATIAEPVGLPASGTGFPQSTHLAWGLGWGIETREKPVSIWHWGSNPGFRSLVLADLRSRDAIVVLTSSDKGMAVAKELVSSAIPGDHPCLRLELVR